MDTHRLFEVGGLRNCASTKRCTFLPEDKMEDLIGNWTSGDGHTHLLTSSESARWVGSTEPSVRRCPFRLAHDH